jgi:hypothetical protein
MPVAVVVVMTIVSVLVYPQHALDATNYATGYPADSTADSTADDPADRSGRIIAGAGSLPRSLSDALSSRRKRHCKKSYHASGHHRARFHDTSIRAHSFRASGIVRLRYPRQAFIESCPKRYTTFGRSGHLAPHWSYRFARRLRGQSAMISSDQSDSLASIP